MTERRRTLRRSVVERFWSHVDTTGECWEWTGERNENGYGRINVNGRRLSAHRLSAAIHFGMLDKRWQVLHRCDNRGCVRPDHLFLGDRTDNMRDMAAKGRAAGQSRTSCPQGHEYTPDNTFYWNGWRRCRTCSRERCRRRRERLRPACIGYKAREEAADAH